MYVTSARMLLAAIAAVVLGAGSASAGKDWVALKAGNVFSLDAPRGTHYEPQQGIDSFVGEFAGPGFALDFDYGNYSDRLGDLRADPEFQVENTRIDGHDAVIVSGPGPRDRGCSATFTGVYVTVDSYNALEMNACTDGDKVGTLKAMFRSLKFH